MLKTAFVALISFPVALLALGGEWAAAAVVHLIFAAGVTPLIFAAISHFIPVLTRSGHPERWIRLLPGAAHLAGLLAVGAMQGLIARDFLLLALTADTFFGLILLAWIARRVRRALGKVHPGWRWYAAALSLFVAAMLSALGSQLWPLAYSGLRASHLHLNLLGFVGMAALGTLPVLLPTALGRPDPDAASWLHRRLWPACVSLVWLVIGIGFGHPLAALGGGGFLVVAVGLLNQWQRNFGWRDIRRDGASASLALATLGLCLLLLAAFAHAAGEIAAGAILGAWVLAFLLPLVSGALSQLLPVWRWPGPQTPERKCWRARLVRNGAARAVFLIAGGLAVLAGYVEFAVVLVLVALVVSVLGYCKKPL